MRALCILLIACAPAKAEVVKKRVALQAATKTTFRPTRRYVGAVVPWQEARIGPQFIAAYVSDVTVRPGDAKKRGEVVDFSTRVADRLPWFVGGVVLVSVLLLLAVFRSPVVAALYFGIIALSLVPLTGFAGRCGRK